MNAKDKKVVSRLSDESDNIRAELEELRDAEQEKFDNMSEGLQQSEKGQAIEEAISSLGEALEHASNLMEALDGLTA